MIYFAMNGKWQSEAKGAWTAISRAPWLKAVTLLSKGDCWHGGGLFLSDKTYWLNDGYGHAVVQDSKEVSRDTSYVPPAYYGGEDLSVYYNRLQRDGWVLTTKEESGKWNAITRFEKKLVKGWVLRKIAHEQVGPPKGKGYYWDEHELLTARGESIKHSEWEWAEWVDGKLVWAQNGCLYKCIIKSSSEIGETQLLHDFNGYKFERLAAPY